MYYVKKFFNKDNQCIFKAPLQNKNSAIEYFNRKTEHGLYPVIDYHHIELTNESIVLFDCEV